MYYILAGLIYLLYGFTLSIKINSSVISILPGFIGFLLMTIGLVRLRKVHTNFAKLIPLSGIMIAFSFVIYVLNVVAGISGTLVETILSASQDVIVLFITYYIIRTVMDMEKNRLLNLAGDKLLIFWGICTAFMMLGYIPSFITGLPDVIGLLTRFIVIIAKLLFLFAFSATCAQYKRYEE